jgi:hypothetical protein
MLIWGPHRSLEADDHLQGRTTHLFPVEHSDVMQQWIDLDVPPDYFDDLAHYDGSVVVEPHRGRDLGTVRQGRCELPRHQPGP